jgi:hypothetical protein
MLATGHRRVEKKNKGGGGTRDAAENSLLDQALGPSSTLPKGCGGSLARRKAKQILSDALGIFCLV